MIAYLEGKVVVMEPAFIILDVNGVGYQVKISLITYSAFKGKEKVLIHTFLHIKEDAHTLYGFAESTEKKLFMDLISISGVGPGTALTILSSMSAQEIKEAIITENIRVLQSIKGIGSKTAQRIVLELKDKMKKESLGLGEEMPSTFGSTHNTVRSEALSALVMLGIARNVAEKSIDSILKKEGNTVSLEQLIKMALKTS